MGPTPNEMVYRGEQYESDLGLYYLRARYYNPLTGRFMSRDPDDHSPYTPKALHKYLYAEGDPTDVIDPTGRGGDTVELALLDETPLPVLREVVIQGVKSQWKRALVAVGVFELWCKIDDTLLLVMNDFGMKAEKGKIPEHLCVALDWLK